MNNSNQLVVYCGPMFGQKTSKMLLEVERHRFAGREIHAFKPKIDTRYDSDNIVTHMGWSLPAICVTTGSDIEKYMLENAKDLEKSLIIVDELFMIPDASESLIWFFNRGVDICVASLDLSHACKPFTEVEKILPWATRVEKCPSVCSVCSETAFYTYRKSESLDVVLVGGSESYEPRCRRHHPHLMEI